MPGLIEKAFIEPFDRLAQQLALVVPALIIVAGDFDRWRRGRLCGAAAHLPLAGGNPL